MKESIYAALFAIAVVVLFYLMWKAEENCHAKGGVYVEGPFSFQCVKGDVIK